VSVTPSFQSRRQEAVDAMTSLIQAFPMAAPYALDVLTKNMDWPGARELAERFHHLVPPDAREDGPEQIPPQAQQQMQQMQQMLQLAQQRLQQLQHVIETKQTEQQGQATIRQLELASNERLANLKHQSDLQKIDEKGNSEARLKVLEARLNELSSQNDRLHQRQMAWDSQAIDASRPPEPTPITLPPVSSVKEMINYKDAPPDVRRQIERQAGLVPSQQGDLETAALAAKSLPKLLPKVAPPQNARPDLNPA
jgi:hypothetical protein